MSGDVRKSIVRALLDPLPSHPSVVRRGNRVAELCAEVASLQSERDQLLAANVRLSAELASVTIERDELRAGVEDLKESLDAAARQRNRRNALWWVNL